MKHIGHYRREGWAEGGSSDHFVLCGGGTTGRMVMEEMAITRRKFIVIEKDEDVAGHLDAFLPSGMILRGDAADEEVLERAGVKRAQALVTTLAEDKMNLVVTVTALQMNPSLRVVSRGTNEAWWDRLRKAGAIVVSPSHIGGKRLATGMIHPDATVFMNEMLSAPSDRPIRIEAVVVEPGKEADGKTLGEIDLFRRTGLSVIALASGPGGTFTYNPGNQTRLKTGDRLVVIGDWEAVDRLAAIVGRWE